MPQADVDCAAYFLPNHPALIGHTVAVCGAWKLSDVLERGRRFSLLKRLITSLRPKHDDPEGAGVRTIVMETAPGMQGRALQWFNGYAAIVEVAAIEIGANFIPVNASTWKKYSCGNGQAAKEMIRAQAEQRFRLEPLIPMQDAADALHILAWGLQVEQIRKAVGAA